MGDVTITIGGDFENESSRAFIDAWRRAERGEVFYVRRLAFQSRDAAVSRVLRGEAQKFGRGAFEKKR